MNKRALLCFGSIVLLLGFAAMTYGEAPQTMNYQGILLGTGGNPITSPTEVVISIFAHDTVGVGDALWGETLWVAPDARGRFNVILGEINPMLDTVFCEPERYLGVQVASDPEMSPRVPITSVGYALRISTVDGASGGTISGSLAVGSNATASGSYSMAFGDGVYAGGDYSTITGGQSNLASGLRSTISGGFMHEAFSDFSTIGGGEYNRIQADHAPYATIAGGAHNLISVATTYSDYSTIGGGTQNTISGDFSTIGGGNDNNLSGQLSTISGGMENSTNGTGTTVGGGKSNLAYAMYSTVCGGCYNEAHGECTTVSGGHSNSAAGMYAGVNGGRADTASGDGSIVAGGELNVATGKDASIAGGENNRASGEHASILGGWFNSATGNRSTVGGGRDNHATATSATVAGGAENYAENDHATVSGGNSNHAAGMYSTVAGGNGNDATGRSACVSGGSNNTAGGDYSSVLGGMLNEANGTRSCVLGGDSNTVGGEYSMAFGAGVSNPAYNYVIFYDGGNSGALSINCDIHDNLLMCPLQVGTNTSNGNGAHLTSGGTWVDGSSRTFKENFQPIDAEELLAKIAAMPVESWNYKDSEERHIGPVAEDFVAAFDVGRIAENGNRENTYLAAKDVAGVALIAVKELYKKTKRIEQLEAQLADVITRLEELEGKR